MAQGETVAARRHGEYKIPGGKLVVMDLRVQAGCLHDVQLSGDFFLEPPEVLSHINAALEGLPQTTTVEQLETAVQSVIGADVSMYGITTAGVAEVVRRALA